MTADPAVVRASLADATPDVFWTDRPERPAPRAALTGAGHTADLVVVGGGFTGLWAAIQAKEDDPSRDVVVLERGRFGVAASGRNGGFVSSSLTHGLAQGLACWPDEIDTLERLADENRAGLEASLAGLRHRRRLPRAGRDHDGADRAPGGVGARGLRAAPRPRRGRHPPRRDGRAGAGRLTALPVRLGRPHRRPRRPGQAGLGPGRGCRAARRAAARGHHGHGVRPRGERRRRAHRVGERARRPGGARHRARSAGRSSAWRSTPCPSTTTC